MFTFRFQTRRKPATSEIHLDSDEKSLHNANKLNKVLERNRKRYIMEIKTHQAIDPELCGKPVRLGDGSAVVELKTGPRMAVDDSGLVHGGFIFGLADHAAMIAVNHPNVVLGGANVRFLKPVKTNEFVTAEAKVISSEGKKQKVEVTVKREDTAVFEGEFTCFVLDKHILA